MTTTAFKVPFVALSQATKEIKKELMAAVEEVLDSGMYVLGPEVSELEIEFAKLCDAKFAAGISNGTCVLHLVLRQFGLGEGDEVITVPNSFIATASTIALVGAKPVFIDITPDLNMDPDQIEEAITPHTKAIVPVHLTGRPAKMQKILEIAKRHNLFVLEDAAQAIGTKLDGKSVGSWGDAACFSLHPLKNIHVFGDGGMMTTNDPELMDRMLMARNHGLANRDRCEFWSFNCRLDEIQAAMFMVQMSKLAGWNEERRRLAWRYNERLGEYVDVPQEEAGQYCTFQTYMIQADRRDDLQEHLANDGVQAMVHYPTPIHLQPAAEDLGYTAEDFPVTMRAAGRILSLPIYPGITDEQQDTVIRSITAFYKGS